MQTEERADWVRYDGDYLVANGPLTTKMRKFFESFAVYATHAKLLSNGTEEGWFLFSKDKPGYAVKVGADGDGFKGWGDEIHFESDGFLYSNGLLPPSVRMVAKALFDEYRSDFANTGNIGSKRCWFFWVGQEPRYALYMANDNFDVIPMKRDGQNFKAGEPFNVLAGRASA